jgi:RimJ/RimL family protein N-acetyltransferase
MQLRVRDLQSEDIPLIAEYWESQTPDDIRRMHLDPSKLAPAGFVEWLTKLLPIPVLERVSDPLIWEAESRAVGFTNLNGFDRPHSAEVHLHMFEKGLRGQGLGRQLFRMSVHAYFERHGLAEIYCQPASDNPYPNGMMKALGVPIAKTYVTLPSFICFEHEVNRYVFKCPLPDESKVP